MPRRKPLIFRIPLNDEDYTSYSKAYHVKYSTRRMLGEALSNAVNEEFDKWRKDAQEEEWKAERVRESGHWR